MIMVAGHLTVDPEQHQSILDAKRGVAIAARSAAGRHDFHLTADPIETDRINIYEPWASYDDPRSVQRFRTQRRPTTRHSRSGRRTLRIAGIERPS